MKVLVELTTDDLATINECMYLESEKLGKLKHESDKDYVKKWADQEIVRIAEIRTKLTF